MAFQAMFGEGLEDATGGGEGDFAAGAVEELRADFGF